MAEGEILLWLGINENVYYQYQLSTRYVITLNIIKFVFFFLICTFLICYVPPRLIIGVNKVLNIFIYFITTCDITYFLHKFHLCVCVLLIERSRKTSCSIPGTGVNFWHYIFLRPVRHICRQ